MKFYRWKDEKHAPDISLEEAELWVHKLFLGEPGDSRSCGNIRVEVIEEDGYREVQVVQVLRNYSPIDPDPEVVEESEGQVAPPDLIEL